MMELARRRMMGGSAKPYDAEVEWLGSDGVAYIDTLIDIRNIGKVEADMCWDTLPNTNACDGNVGTASPVWWGGLGFLYSASNQTGAIFGNTTSTIATTVAGKWYTLTLDVSNGSLSDGITTVSINCIYPSEYLTWWIFRRSNGNAAPTKRRNVRIYNTNGVLVRDYIPVSKGNTGYLYDKVSGRLFGNQGTGQFIIGPDK